MLSRITSATVKGVEGFLVAVEVDLSRGLPSFGVVGLPDASIRESRDRVVSALRNSGFDVPTRRLTVNLAPADVRKEGPSFDLPIAIGVLEASGQMAVSLERVSFLGELSLDGTLRPTRGVLPCVMALRDAGLKMVVIPEANGKEAAVVDGIEVYAFSSLLEVARFISGNVQAAPIQVDRLTVFRASKAYRVDIQDVRGQEHAKRALEVAAAGGHNILLLGPPGSGKTLLAKRLPTILADLSFEEALEVTKIHSIAGLLGPGESVLATRPFRSPHHTISDVALVGGGSSPRPGEISLAHKGVLFLDELPEFKRTALEVLRQPLEEHWVRVTRVSSSASFPADFMLVAAMNPCPCGYLGHPERPCICTPHQTHKYRSRISGPILDRIDMHVEVPALAFHELTLEGPAPEDSAAVRARVMAARDHQGKRLSEQGGPAINARMDTVQARRFCRLCPESRSLLRDAVRRLGLSARGYEKILKVARTIADLEGMPEIAPDHVSEAVSYRTLDRSSLLTPAPVAG